MRLHLEDIGSSSKHKHGRTSFTTASLTLRTTRCTNITHLQATLAHPTTGSQKPPLTTHALVCLQVKSQEKWYVVPCTSHRLCCCCRLSVHRLARECTAFLPANACGFTNGKCSTANSAEAVKETALLPSCDRPSAGRTKRCLLYIDSIHGSDYAVALSIRPKPLCTGTIPQAPLKTFFI